MTVQHGIRLFLADVDGALVTKDKVLTDAAQAAVRELKDAGYTFVALDLQGYRTGSFNETESYPAAPAHHVQRPVASCRR